MGGKFRFGPGLPWFALVIGQNSLAIGIRRTAPEKHAVGFALAPDDRRSALRTHMVSFYPTIQNGREEVWEIATLFLQKTVKAFPAACDGFKTGFLFGCAYGIFQVLRREAYQFPAQWR